MKPIPFSIFYFIAVIIIAHFFVPPEYVWTQNTISELASQGLPNQWIMQIGFIGFGILFNLGFVLKFIAEKKVTYADMPLMTYGLSILVTGFYSAAPFLENVTYSLREAGIHSLFATVAGIAFTLGILWRAAVAGSTQERLVHILFLVLVTGASALFGVSESGIIPLGKGIAQRALYLVSFVWILIDQRFF